MQIKAQSANRMRAENCIVIFIQHEYSDIFSDL